MYMESKVIYKNLLCSVYEIQAAVAQYNSLQINGEVEWTFIITSRQWISLGLLFFKIEV